MPGREELLQSIHPEMKLDRAFFLKIYGYEISFPGFQETAIKSLEVAGCSRAQEYYDLVVGEYEKKSQEQIRKTGEWYLKKCNDEWEMKVKEGEGKRQELKQYLSRMNDRELLNLLQTLS